MVSHIKTDWNMKQFDVLRLHDLLSQIDMLAISVNNGATKALKPYISALRQLYKNLRPYIQLNSGLNEVEGANQLDERFKGLQDKMSRINSNPSYKRGIIPIRVREDLDFLENELPKWRYILGLSFETERAKSFEDKLNALWGKK